MPVYRHILIPIDGSRESERAAAMGVRLGKALGSRVSAVHIVADPPATRLEAWAHHDRMYGPNLAKALESRAVLFLESIRDIALRAGVCCECHLVHGGVPHEEILKAAEEHECDLIVMASHRMGAETGVMLDGETIKVLARGPVPVLVCQ
jgi:nucleotide-binding universal stress UspA family protein